MDHVSPEEARPNLADLVRINERLGGHSTLRKTLQRARLDGSFTLLDVGAASGDSARVVKDAYPVASITSLDYNSANLEAAPKPKLLANAFELPFQEASFDYVLCSLFLHHFTDDQVTELLRNFYRIARKALLVCDLERHILPYLFLSGSRRIFKWNRITVHDGLISIRASFRAGEFNELAKRAGIAKIDIKVYRPAFRLSMVGWK